MKKVILAVVLIAVISLVSCGAPELHYANKIEISITDDGCDIRGTDVLINNYYKGARAEIEYMINNNSSVDIEPVIYVRFKVDPSNYSKGNDFVAVPTYFNDWLDIPKCGVIESGMAKSYLIILEIPKDATEIIPEKWAFKVGVDPKMGAVNNAVATWYRVDMR